MKLGKKRTGDPADAFNSSRPARNQSKKSGLLILVIIVTALLITWVYSMGVKATETVTVVMLAQNVYKNQQITDDMLQAYDMVKAEFEKYAIDNGSGKPVRRILLWEEKNMIKGAYAAYPLQANTLLEYRSVYKYKIDNSDSVLYSFPGKEIVAMDIGTSELQTFKTFLEPGDRVNISAIYTEEEEVVTTDLHGGLSEENVTVYRDEIVFQDIMVADLLNSSGESILDIYADYNSRTVAQQSALDASAVFQDSVEPRTLLVAMTPEEKLVYFEYLNKDNLTFVMTLPQRVK